MVAKAAFDVVVDEGTPYLSCTHPILQGLAAHMMGSEHHAGRTIPGVPAHAKDCPATRGMDRHHAYQRCRRCRKPCEALVGKEP